LTSSLANLLCNRPGSCSGLFLAEVAAESADECLEACKTFPGFDRDGDEVPDDFCNWFTYNTLNGDCELFEGCLDVDQSCTTCVSGNSGCEPGSAFGMGWKMFNHYFCLY